jgi:hypothetical protein
MCAHHTERSDVTVWHTITGLLLHLCENIADNLGWVVRCLLRAGYLEREKKKIYERFVFSSRQRSRVRLEKATHIDGDIAELRPAHGMVHVVFAKVVFGQVGNVGLLDMGNVV